MGGSKINPNRYTSIEVRFHKKGLKKLGIYDIIMKYEAGRAEKLLYYHYNVHDAEDFTTYVKQILREISDRLLENYGDQYTSSPQIAVPETLRELPRYGD